MVMPLMRYASCPRGSGPCRGSFSGVAISTNDLNFLIKLVPLVYKGSFLEALYGYYRRKGNCGEISKIFRCYRSSFKKRKFRSLVLMATPENDPRQGPEPLGHEAYRISGITIIYFPSKWGEGKPDSVALTLGKEGEPTSADVTELPDFQLWGILGEKARQAVLRAYLTAHPDLVTDVRLVRNL